MNSNNKKKSKLYNSRIIKTQINDKAFDKLDKKLSISQFLSSRKFEIQSFESSQLKSKNASSTRIFQSLPRSLRRRAASHDIKRIPKRMRNKALREMNPATTTKSIGKKIPHGRQLYKLFKMKRVLKIASKLKQMKYEVPFDSTINIRKQYKALNDYLKIIQFEKPPLLNNVNGSKDQTGTNRLSLKPTGNIKYSKRQNKFVWLPTHIWHAKRFKMMKNYNYQIPFKPTQKCFKLMNRQNKFKAVCFDTSYYPTMILEFKEQNQNQNQNQIENILKQLLNSKNIPKTLISGKKTYNDWIYFDSKPIVKGLIFVCNTRILIRMFPSVYPTLFEKLKNLIQDVGIIYDCRYSLGSIELSGPLSLKYLSKVFYFHELSPNIRNLWSNFIQLKDNNLIPIGTTFSFNLKDPRIYRKPSNFPFNSNKDLYDLIIDLQNKSTVESQVIDNLFTIEGRTKSYENQLSLKQLGKYFDTPQKKASDVSHSEIPIILTKINTAKWCFILPWHWVLPFWHQLNKIPGLKPGGLKQIKQFQFESNLPSFPQDYPWLKDGWIHNDLVGEATYEKDSKLPKSQVTLQDSENKNKQVFNAYKCDWNTLRNMIFLKNQNLNDTEILCKIEEFKLEINDINDPVIEKFNEFNQFHEQFYNNQYQIEPIDRIIYTKLPVFQILINLVNDGAFEDNARIYSEPNNSHFECIGFVTTGGLNLNVEVSANQNIIWQISN
ncbi:unnamed protein product [Candida verbasci]|uniref:Uncharacterized protein n=1 Tax=Candida verbasci TaxID=1227364 RepID=A0A9W4TSM8_9ASCO|nr:unnamed protein product [Candida verbasci]